MVNQIKAIRGADPYIKKKRITLAEDDFVESLEKIITRFYFPELLKINQYKEWRRSKASMVGVLSVEGDSVSQRFAVGEEVDEEERKKVQLSEDVKRLTLNQFMAKYTSEDNKALDDLMEKDREKFMETHGWMYKPFIKETHK